ncbi:MAG: hypothetical protein IKC48_05665 [Clostridia bacterium]|nr:hypothetical protein [Clostridia bacterium]
MHETKNQLRVIAALLVVVLSLAVGLVFYQPTAISASAGDGSITDEGEGEQPTPHQRVREATVSLDPSFAFSQTIGGSGDEQLVDVFYHGERLYIFGNTTSVDYDFDRSGAFVAITDAYGKTLDFVSYEGKLVAVTLYEGGYLLAIDQSSTPIAIAIDYDGREKKSLALPTVRAEVALDVKYVDGGYLFVTSLIQGITDFTKLKLTILTPDLEFKSSVVTDEVYSLDYVDTLDIMGSYKLVANALSSLRNMLCTGTWGEKLAHFPHENSYTVSSFWVTDDIYYLATTVGKTMLITESGDVITLTGAASHYAISGDDRYIYVSAGSEFFCLDGSKISFSASYGVTSFWKDNGFVHSVSTLGSKMSIRSFLAGSKVYESTFVCSMTNAKVFTCEDGMLVLGNTSNTFGGDDITFIKINY